MKNIKKPYFKKPIDSLYETMNDKGESVVRFRSNDNRERFIGTSLDPNKVPGGDTPSPSPMPSGGGMVEVTWQELKDKRDNGQLIPGSLYRITDYNCTTTQENTKSAGHQFDIVLLALSEDKLAEEGWAMMNESNIYDVTFADGVTKKCYIYKYNIDGDFVANVIITDNNLGIEALPVDGRTLSIDEINKTAVCGHESTGLFQPNIQRNYFQYSNLSAWKVWYCLDNDKNRFAWADDSSPSIYNEEFGYWFVRDASKDVLNKYAWYNTADDSTVLTDNLEPKIGDICYSVDGLTVNGTVSNLRGFGRGVIYRLIDEWNNDVGYDFKNIQFIRPMIDGDYDPKGEDTWVYTLNNVGVEHDVYDASLNTTQFDNSTNNKIDSLYTFINDKNCFELPDVVILYGGGFNNISKSSIITILQNVVKMQGCQDCTIGNADSQFYICDTMSTTEMDKQAIYINNLKVLTEE